MPMSKALTGILCGLTGMLTGHASIALMMQTVHGAPWSWWGPAMLGASILMMVVAAHSFLPKVTVSWLSAIAAATPIAICSLFQAWPSRCWVFAGILGVSSWIIFKIDTTFRHGDIAALLVSVLLAVCWIPASVNTVHAALAATAALNLVALGVLGLYWALIVSVLIISGRSVLRQSPG